MKKIQFITPKKAEQLKRHTFRKGDIVITKLGEPLGKACIVPNDLEYGVVVADVVRARINEEAINRQYLVYAINSQFVIEQLQPFVKGSTRPRVNLGQIRNLSIPVAPMPEQERIVAKIEELFTELDVGMAALRRIQTGLKRYRASMLKAAYEGRLMPQDLSDEPAEELLHRLGKSPLAGEGLSSLPKGWCWVRIVDIADINVRDTAIRDLPDDLPVTFVPMAAVNGDKGIIARPEEHLLKEVRKGFTTFSDGDVIFAKITPCMENGKAAIAQKLRNGRGFGSTEFHVLRPKEVVHAKWLFYFIRQESFRKDAKANFKGTAGQLRVPASFLVDYPIPLPPLAEQQRIVVEVERLLSVAAEVEAAVGAALARSGRLRQAILKLAFEGKLVEQNPKDRPSEELIEMIRTVDKSKGKSTPKQARLF